MKKRMFLVLLALCMVAMLFSGCSAVSSDDTPEEGTASQASTDAPAADGEDGFVIGFSNCVIGNTWRSQFVDEAEETILAYKEQGLVKDYVISNANNDITEQINQVNSMINAGIDALVIEPCSTEGFRDVFEDAISKGIIVVICDMDAPYEGTYSIPEDIPNTMTISAEWMAKTLGTEGEIVYITGVAGNPNDTQRIEAVDKVLANYPNINLLGSAPGEWSNSTAQTATSNFLATYGDSIDGVLAQDCMGEGIIQAYENAGLSPKVICGSVFKSFFDTWNDYPDLKAICVPCDTRQGSWGVHMAIGLLQGRELKEELVLPSAVDANVVNCVRMDPPYIVIHDKETENPEFLKYMEENWPNTVIYTLEEVQQLCDGKGDDYSLSYDLTQTDIDRLFK